ncbi:unnamed protein product, partial [Didymodactylos carnosus]
ESTTETISFGLRNDPASTSVDDVSVMNGTQQLLSNGGFETGSLSPWQGAAHVGAGNPHSGTYSYNDGVVGSLDYVYQTFQTVPGTLLNISFWISWGGSGSLVQTNITIYPSATTATTTMTTSPATTIVTTTTTPISTTAPCWTPSGPT